MNAADRAYLALLALAGVSSALLVALFLALAPHVPEDAVSTLILSLASIGLLLGVASLARQLFDTHEVIRRLLRARVPAPAVVAALAAELGIAGRVDVVGDERPFAFAYWFARPRVCLSTGMVERLEEDELRAVLSHERWHLARRDPLRIVVARYLAAGLYVVPVVDDLLSHYELLKEVAADDHAVRALGSVRPLARALYRLMPHADEIDMGLLAPVGGLSVTEARIDQLVEHTPIATRLDRAHVALSVATLVGAALLLAAQAPRMAGNLDVALGWPPAAVIALAAIPGVAHQLRAVTLRR